MSWISFGPDEQTKRWLKRMATILVVTIAWPLTVIATHDGDVKSARKAQQSAVTKAVAQTEQDLTNCPALTREQASTIFEIQSDTPSLHIFSSMDKDTGLCSIDGDLRHIGIMWQFDPTGESFRQSASAINCEPVNGPDIRDACWNSKHDGIFFHTSKLSVYTAGLYDDRQAIKLMNFINDNLAGQTA